MNRTANNNSKLYNVKILRNFVVYLQRVLGWGDDRIEKLLEESGFHKNYIDIDDNWFDQETADRFHDQVVLLTGDPDVAYKVGKFMFSDFSLGVAGRFFLASLSPLFVFKNLPRVGPTYTKGSHYVPISVKRGHIVFRSLINEGCVERRYQCRNRLGMIEAVPAAFGGFRVRSTHNVCLHEGGAYCEYELTWRDPVRYRPIPTAMGIGSLVGALTFFFSSSLLSSVFALLSSALATYAFLQEQLMSLMRKNLDKQNRGLEESLTTMTRRREEQILLSQIIRTTTEMRPTQELTLTAVERIRREMKYDRVLLLLVTPDKKMLKVSATSGLEPGLQELVENSEFRIREDNLSGYFIRVVNTKRPILEQDVQNNLSQLSERTQSLVKTLGTKAFVAVPILFKSEVLGVLSVENTQASKPLNSNDVELLSSLADHLAVAMTNAANFTATQEALKATQVVEKQQREARELFEKYVPSGALEKNLSGAQSLTFLESKFLDVMFIDIVGFSALSEKRPAYEVAKLLNIYIEEINEIVAAKGGSINKIIGDGLFIYSDPIHFPSLPTALAIRNHLDKLNEKLIAQNLPKISISLGLHRGVCSIGNIGYNKRLDFTLIGDTVNIAARIENSTRPFGENKIFFSHTMLDETEGYEYTSRGKVSMKGISKPIEIYELDGVIKAKKAA